MIVVRTRAGQVFVDEYSLDESGNLKGHKIAKTGSRGTIIVPAAAIQSIETWEKEEDIETK